MLLLFFFFAWNKNVKTKSYRGTKRTSNRNKKSRNTKKRIEKKKELEKLEIKKTELARKIAIEEIERLRIPIAKLEDLEKNRTCKRSTRKIRYRNRKNTKWRISRKTRNSKRYDKR